MNAPFSLKALKYICHLKGFLLSFFFSDSDYQSGLKKKQEEIKNLRKAVYDLSEKKYELLQKLDWISVKRKMANSKYIFFSPHSILCTV